MVRAWVVDLARRARARSPDVLARQLTLLLDGGLAAGVLDTDPSAAVAAKQAARVLVEASCSHRDSPPPARSPGAPVPADRRCEYRLNGALLAFSDHRVGGDKDGTRPGCRARTAETCSCLGADDAARPSVDTATSSWT